MNKLRFHVVVWVVWVIVGMTSLSPGIAHARGRGRAHVVQAGQTLWDIARVYGCEVSAVQKANRLDSELIQPGQTLSIPGGCEMPRNDKPEATATKGSQRDRTSKGQPKSSAQQSNNRAQHADLRARPIIIHTQQHEIRAPEPEKLAQPAAVPQVQQSQQLEQATQVDELAEKLADELLTKPADEPIAEQLVRQIDEPMAKSMAKQIDEPMAKQIVTPAQEPVARQIVTPAEEPIAKPAAKQIAKAVAKQAQEPAIKLVAKAVDDGHALVMTHQVGPGDTLMRIAQRYDTSIDDLRRRNGIEGHVIMPGQSLRVAVGKDGQGRPIPGQSVGSASSGQLVNGMQLAAGHGYHLRRPQRAWGANHTIYHVRRVVSVVRSRFPKIHDLAIGDISTREGGQLAEHRSHQSGRDVDLGLYYKKRPKGYPESFIKATEDNLDFAATWALIEALAETERSASGVELMFLDYQLQELLYDWARDHGISEAVLGRLFQYPRGEDSPTGLIRHEPGHDCHVHVRFKCPEDDKGCW